MNKLVILAIVVLVVVAGVVAYVLLAVPGAGGATTTSTMPGLAATTTQSAAKITTQTSSGDKIVLTIFSAGSLKVPLEKVAREFEKRCPNVEVRIEFSGSVDAVRKVIDLGRRADILALADYRLVPMYMFGKYADWVVAFAVNRLVLAYTEHSKYADFIEKNPDRWYEVLMKPGVRYGFSNPNRDPCGYRAVGALALASLFYNNSEILEKLVVENLEGVKVEEKNGELHVYVSASIRPKDGLVIRPKGVELIQLLEAGALDYAFEYESVAKQHNLKYVVLPEQINLGNPKYASFYGKVVVHINVGTPVEKTIRMAPIIYGITIPSNAPHPDWARKFMEFLLTEGRRIFEECGQHYLPKPIVYATSLDKVPDWLRGMAHVKEWGGC